MTTTVQSKSSFVFVHSDSSGLNRSKQSRAIVRSQAARSARSAALRNHEKPEDVADDASTSQSGKRKAVSLQDREVSVAVRNTGSVKALMRRRAIRENQQLSLLIDPTDPLIISQPLLTQRYSPVLVSHYLTQMAVDIPELDLDRPGLLRSVWFPFALTSGPLIHIILLTAGANYSNYVDMDSQQMKNVRQCLVQLKQQALQQMRQMAFSTTGPGADALIAAALKMASFEAMFGSTDAFRTHMAGLKNLVEGRGGFDSLGLGGLLARMVCWVDSNSSYLLNSPLYFADRGSTLPKQMDFDPQSFIGGS